MPDLFLFPRNVFFVFITVPFHKYDIVWHMFDDGLWLQGIYGLCIHVNVDPSQMFWKKYSEINAKNLQYMVMLMWF